MDELWASKADKTQISETKNNLEDVHRSDVNELNLKINEQFDNLRNELKLAVNDILLDLDRKVNLEDHNIIKAKLIPDLELMLNQQMNMITTNNENL